MALHAVYPELALEDEAGVGRFSYPRPLSEPPSPTSSRATTPIPSDEEDEDDEVDEEREVSCKVKRIYKKKSRDIHHYFMLLVWMWRSISVRTNLVHFHKKLEDLMNLLNFISFFNFC